MFVCPSVCPYIGMYIRMYVANARICDSRKTYCSHIRAHTLHTHFTHTHTHTHTRTHAHTHTLHYTHTHTHTHTPSTESASDCGTNNHKPVITSSLYHFIFIPDWLIRRHLFSQISQSIRFIPGLPAFHRSVSVP